MKNSIIMMFCMVAFMACDKETTTIVDQPNQEILTFVDLHYPNDEIIQVTKEEEYRDVEFNVTLSNGAQLNFSEKYVIREITDFGGIPSTALNPVMVDYLEENFSNLKVVDWEVLKYRQEVELSNGLEMVFDLDGRFVRIDD